MPSDHLVKDAAAFLDSLKRAAAVAAAGKLVLFGIVPSGPHTRRATSGALKDGNLGGLAHCPIYGQVWWRSRAPHIR